jgi:hypothetical protein
LAKSKEKLVGSFEESKKRCGLSQPAKEEGKEPTSPNEAVAAQGESGLILEVDAFEYVNH